MMWLKDHKIWSDHIAGRIHCPGVLTLIWMWPNLTESSTCCGSAPRERPSLCKECILNTFMRFINRMSLHLMTWIQEEFSWEALILVLHRARSFPTRGNYTRSHIIMRKVCDDLAFKKGEVAVRHETLVGPN